VEPEDLAAVLCARACDYYRPGKPEPDRCGGFECLRALAASDRLPEGWPEVLGSPTREPLAHDRFLAEAVCSACAFRPADCDYRDPDGPPDAPPCGGLRALDRMLGLGFLAAAALAATESQARDRP